MKKHQVIETWIRNRIDEGVLVPGEKLPSESQLCAQFGVSRNAVRQAIHNLIHEGTGRKHQGSRHLLPHAAARVSPVREHRAGRVLHRLLHLSRDHPRLLQHPFPQGASPSCSNQSEYNLEQERAILQDLQKEEGRRHHHRARSTARGTAPTPSCWRRSRTRASRSFSATTTFPGGISAASPWTTTGCGEEAAAHLWKKGHRKIGIFYQKDFLVKANRMKGVLDYLGRQEAPVQGRLDRRIQRPGTRRARPPPPRSGSCRARGSFPARSSAETTRMRCA